MTVGRPAWKRILAWACVTAAVAGVTFAVATITRTGLSSEDSSEMRRATGARDRLAICVQAVTPGDLGGVLEGDRAVEDAAKSATEAALVAVAEHPLWGQAGFAENPPVVDVACPSSPLPLRAGQGRWHNGLPEHLVQLPEVAEESYYSVFVFVMPSVGDIEGVLGGGSRRVVPQEFLCDHSVVHGRECRQATRGVYVTPDEVADNTVMVELLAKGAGLAP